MMNVVVNRESVPNTMRTLLFTVDFSNNINRLHLVFALFGLFLRGRVNSFVVYIFTAAFN